MHRLLTSMLVGIAAGALSALPAKGGIESAFVGLPGRIEAARPPDGAPFDLEQLLERMARIAAIYERNALGFTVDESTSVVTYDYRDGFKSTYDAPDSVYCYYDAGHGRLDDRRVEKRRVKELHKRMARSEDISAELTNSVDPLRHNLAVPSYVDRPYSWIMLFSKKQQPRYSYRFEGMHKQGLVIGFEPREGRGPANDWYGRAIVDAESYQIVRAEGQQRRDLQELQLAEAMLQSDRDLPQDPAKRTFVETWVQAEFGRDQGGLRLPTKVETTVYHHLLAQPVDQKHARLRRAHEVVQKYRHYMFFGVDVQHEIDAVRYSED